MQAIDVHVKIRHDEVKIFTRKIKYYIDTKYYCYYIKTYENLSGTWELNAYIDTDYAGEITLGRLLHDMF